VGAAAAYKELSVLPLVVVVGVVLFMLARELGLGATEESFVLLLILVGFTLTLGTELFFLKDSFGTRMNTVFKFYYQAWLLFAIASAYGLYWVAAKLKATRGWLWLKGLWWSGVAVFLAAALAYPVAASFSRMDMFQRRPSLDGLAFVKGFDPTEYEAIEWLKGNIEGSPTIVEAPGGAYTDFGRVSSRTGIPTVIQWPGHEAQWRGPLKELGEREQDVNQIYSSPDTALVQRLLNKYGVTYVYAGRLERARYGESGLVRFASTMDTVFQNQGVSIYRVRR
jgi:YYY domain-containing protein